jgi:hypothetical protein
VTCALVGDFNAKTAVLEDFSEPDETFLNVMDVNVEDGLFRYRTSGSEKSSKTAVLALKSPTSAHVTSFSIKFTN